MVRCTFSPARAWRPAVVASLARTLGLMKTRTLLGIVVTIAWCTAVASLLWIKRGSLGDLKVNEWGDFFAGSVAPLAFFWLVLGYMQQGEELQTNTDALRAQEKQLGLQVKETADLVAASARQAAAAEVQATAVREDSVRRAMKDEAEAQPVFTANGGIGAEPNITLHVFNTGATARDIVIDHPESLQIQIFGPERLTSGGTLRVLIQGHGTYPYDFSIRYKDTLGVTRVRAFTMFAPFRFEPNEA